MRNWKHGFPECFSPRINFRFFEVPMDEGMVVLMEIPCAEKQPVQFAGGNL